MAQKHFVLDTNVLIENPKCITALRNGVENQIYIPYTVLHELDGLKKDPRIGHIVSQAVRAILEDEDVNIFPPGFCADPHGRRAGRPHSQGNNACGAGRSDAHHQ